MAASEFKARCLQVMDEVQASGETILITKHRRPVACLGPAPRRRKSMFGDLAGTATLRDDFDWTAPVIPPEDWGS